MTHPNRRITRQARVEEAESIDSAARERLREMASRAPPPPGLIAAARELGRAEAALEYARGEERCFSLKRLTPEQVIVAMFCKALKIDMNRVTYEDHGLCVLIKEDGTGRYWRAFDGDPGRDCVAGEHTILADDYTSMSGGVYAMER